MKLLRFGRVHLLLLILVWLVGYFVYETLFVFKFGGFGLFDVLTSYRATCVLLADFEAVDCGVHSSFLFGHFVLFQNPIDVLLLADYVPWNGQMPIVDHGVSN